VQSKYDEASALYERAVAIDEVVYGADHPNVAVDLFQWAELLKDQVGLKDA